jgi:glycosidase
MPDLYYGPYAKASESETFKDLAAAADKWIDMGVAGLRLDAVIWIYQNNTAANVSFLKQWYDRCNSTWKAKGGKGDFYMVGEAWCDNAEKMAPYYEGLPSNFNFYYWYTLKDRIGKGKGDDFAQTVIYFQDQFRKYRTDFIDAIKLTNHDEDRAANDLGRDVAKEKLAAAVLLTSPGKPYIYQGEELGYWGNKGKGDEYVRAPIKWTRDGSVPSAALNGKVDNAMLTADISVEAQEKNDASVLRVYRNFAKARNAWKALAQGQIEAVSSPNSAVAVWKMSYEGQTVLVVHNFGTGGPVLPLTNYKTDKLIVSNGTVTVSNGAVAMGAYSSAVFLQ